MPNHAELSPSSARRWMGCPGSVRLIRGLPEWERDRTSAYAQEGSAAHALAEYCLQADKNARDFLGQTLPSAPAFEVDDEMADAVQVYLDEVRHHQAVLPCAELLVEQRVTPLPSRPEVFGTSDALVHDPIAGELVVLDYKHGAGVPVEVERNPQVLCYALGALRLIGETAVESVTLVVVQPRAPHSCGPVRRWGLSTEDLLAWADELESAIARTEVQDTSLAVGDWCRFCPAQASCPAMRAHVADLAKADFSIVPAEASQRLPVIPEPQWLARAMAAVPIIDSWCREVEGSAQRLLERGIDVPGYKLVRKRAHRRWGDPEEVERRLRTKRGVRRSDLYDVRLKSPAQMERIGAIGRDWVDRHAMRPEGELTIAALSDPRPALPAPAQADFPALPSRVEDLSFLD